MLKQTLFIWLSLSLFANSSPGSLMYSLLDGNLMARSFPLLSCLLLLCLSLGLTGCESLVAGRADKHNAVYEGELDSLFVNRGFMRLQQRDSTTTCQGLWKTLNLGASAAVADLKGGFQLQCSDNRVILGEWKALDSGEAEAKGSDQQQNAFTFRVLFDHDAYEKQQQGWATEQEGKPALPPMPTRLTHPAVSAYSWIEPITPKAVKVSGTAFFITKDGYFLTANHVVDKQKRLFAVDAAGVTQSVTIIATDPLADLALGRVAAWSPSPFIPLAATAPAAGEAVFTLGYPVPDFLGWGQKANFGRVNSLSGVKGSGTTLQVDLGIQPGNSGGPLLNHQGEVVGVVVSTVSNRAARWYGLQPQAINYAVRPEIVSAFLKEQQQAALTAKAPAQPADPKVWVERYAPAVFALVGY